MTCALAFVDSVAEEPTVRLNLSDGSTWRYLEETDFPPPPLKRSIASTLLADGGVIPSSAYDLRTLTLVLTLNTGSADETATELQKLHRELDRPGNILMWNEFTSEPVFFRTFRTSPSAVHRSGMSDGTRKRISVEILAEPFAYGLREDPVDGVTVSTDPAAGSNGCFVDVEGVKGDVEAPAIIQWPNAAVVSLRQTLFATRSRGTPSAALFLLQAEALTQGTNTTTQTNSADFSGSGNNYSRCTFTTATMQTRLSTDVIGTPSVDLRGRYRVLLRYRKNTSGDGINLQLRWGDTDGGVVVTNDAYATPNTTTITTADLGEISVPVGTDPVTGSDGVELAVSDAFRLQLRAERTSGSGSIDFDFLLLIPADTQLAIVRWLSVIADHWILDANCTTAHARDSSGRVVSAGAPAIVGGFPMLTPNQTNRIVMLRSIRATDAWTLTTVSPVSVSYHPRYLSVRPAST